MADKELKAQCQTAAKIMRYLRKSKISRKVEEIIPGPIITRYTFKPYVGTVIKDIFAIVPDIEIIAESSTVRVSHITNTSLMAIDIPNKERRIALWEDMAGNADLSEYKLPIIMGCVQDGDIIGADLHRLKHLLITGRPGTGKTTFVKSAVMSLRAKCSDTYKMVIIDSTQEGFNILNGDKIMYCDTINDITSAADYLDSVATEIHNRQKLLLESKAYSIEEYNQKHENPIPYMVIICNELHNLLGQDADTAEDIKVNINNLTTMGHNVGVHLIAISENVPYCDFAYFPSRLQFNDNVQNDDITEEEYDSPYHPRLLLPYGHAFFSDSGKVPVAIHTPYINIESMNEVAINTANVFEELMNHTLTLEKLKNFIATGIWINSCDSNGMSLLTILCLRDNIEMAEVLIQAGADVNMPNKLDGRTPIFWGNADICRLLIKYGADPNYKACGYESALFHSGDDIEKTKLLIDNGADIHSKDPYTGWTALYFVENADCARTLIQNGASINIDNDKGASLIEKHMDKPDVLRVLIENGAVITKDSPLAKLVMDEELLTLIRKSLK